METPDFALLPVLDAVLQEGSVTGAARRLGLSVPATSHALARLRDQLGDPILVRAGRAMMPTPRAEALRDRVRALAAEARQVLSKEEPLDPARLDRSFVVHATDHALSVLGLALDRRLSAAAPSASLQFLPNVADDAAAIRAGTADLAIGIYRDLPPEMLTRALFTDRFVCVVRKGHPILKRRLSLELYCAQTHVQVAPRGRPGGYVDQELETRGLARKIVRAVPYFMVALSLAGRTDHVLTVSERIARQYASAFGLEVLEPPLPLRPYALSLLWHPRHGGDHAHRWLREQIVESATEAAPEAHPHAMTKLGQRKKRRR